MPDSPDRVARPLDAAWPITDTGFIASVITGSLPQRHGVGADRIHDLVLRAPRPRCREDLRRTPIWDVLARHGIGTAVFGTPLADAWPGRRPPDIQSSDIPSEAVRSVLGDHAADALSAQPGPDRTEACRARELLAMVALTHEEAIGHLQSDGQTGFTAVTYQELGELFRSRIVNPARLGGFVGQMLAALRDALSTRSRLITCTMPTEPQNACVSHAAPAGRVARGAVLVSPAPTTIGTGPTAIEDVFDSILAAFGLPHAIDVCTSDALGIGTADRPDPLFTHSDEHPIDPASRRHPDAEHIPSLDNPGTELPGDDYPGRGVLGRIDAGIRAVSAINAGDTAAARDAADQSEGEPRFIATDAFFAFDAAERRDATELAARLEHLEQTVGETPLTAAGKLLVNAASDGPEPARTEIGRLSEAFSKLPSQAERDAAQPLLARAAELAGLPAEAEKLWKALQTQPGMNVSASFGIARCAIAQSRWTDALAHTRTGRAGDTRSIEGIRLEIEALEGAELLDEAATLALRLLSLDPADVESRKTAARLLRAAGRQPEATRVGIGDDSVLLGHNPDQASSL